MDGTSARALQLVTRKPFTLRQLSQQLGTSYSRTAGITRRLIQEGYAKRTDSMILLARNAKTELVKVLSSKFNMETLLSDAQGRVLLTLKEPKTAEAIMEETRLSQSAVYSALRKLSEIGAILETDSGYRVAEDENLKSLVRLLAQEETARSAEPFATTLKVSSRGQLLKRVASEVRAQGSLTGFSLFPGLGLEYFTPFDYYLDPPQEVGPEEAIVHALASSASLTDRTVSVLLMLKHRTQLDPAKSRKLAEEWGVLEDWLDARRMAEGIAPERNERFLPWKEYVEKARVYGLQVREPPGAEAGLTLLRQVGTRLSAATEAYLFGGGNMLLRGLKAATKDVDLIVNGRDVFQRIARSLTAMGFKRLAERDMRGEDRRLEPSGIYVADHYPRVDLFTKSVLGKFQLTDDMKARAEERLFNNLRLKLLSLEDVFLFKSITDRAGDLEDMASIVRKTPRFDWPSLLNTYWAEEKLTGRHFCFTILDNIELLQEKEGIRAPIQRRLLQHCIDTGILESVKRGASTVAEIRKLVNFPEHRLRNRLRALIDNGKLVRQRPVRGKPPKAVRGKYKGLLRVSLGELEEAQERFVTAGRR